MTSQALSRPRVARDPKAPLWTLALVVPALPFIAFVLHNATGSGWAWWLTPVVVFVVVPIIDVLLGDDRANLDEATARRLQAVRYYRWITYSFVPIQYAALAVACAVWVSQPLDIPTAVGLILTAGIVSGLAINTAHELGHKREEVERWLSRVALAPSFYGHFYVEHNRGHHVRVATPDDPASARLGEGFWTFWPRTVWGSLRSAWRMEIRRFRRRGQSPWTLRNDVLNSWVFSVALVAALTMIYGWAVLPFVVGQAVIGFTFLELVNYLEHYGLARQRQPNGRYDNVDPRHSWNSDRVLTNLFLFQLQRHSDHHANPLRRYQTLRSFDSSPVLPAGYATMILVALVPPLWRKLMDPQVLAHYAGDRSRANTG